MEFYLEDFTEGTKKTIREEFDFSKNEEDKPVAVRFNAAANEKTPEVDAEIQQINSQLQQLVAEEEEIDKAINNSVKSTFGAFKQ